MLTNFMVFTVIVAVIQATKISPPKKNLINCDKHTLLYQELQCTPQTFNNDGCPTSYTCPEYKTGSDFCRYRGAQYNIDEKVPGKLTPPCLFGCMCYKLPSGDLVLSCAQPKCRGGSGNENCYLNYTSADSCCPTEELCGPFEGSTCKVGKDVYQIDERYEPENSCSVCLCKKNQEGVAVPECQKKVCGTEIRNSKKIEQNCAPIYSGKGCCPDKLVCTEDLERITFTKFGSLSQNTTCKFQAFNFPLGTSFEADRMGSQVACSCDIPPLLTCTYLEN